MYIPASFRQSDRQTLLEFVRRHSFGVLVSQHDGEPCATHLPLLLDADVGQHGHLLGHVARPNPQWQQLAGQEVLAIFSGPHAYISPSWYGVAPAVPTWNYLAVHVYGRCQLIDNEADLLELLSRSVETYEQPMPTPWRFVPDDPFVQKLLNGIVGFRVVVSRIEGKWKLGQNHAVGMRENVASQLATSADADAREIAALMVETLGTDD